MITQIILSLNFRRTLVVSAVTLLVCLINVPDLHVVSIAKLYVIKNLNLNLDIMRKRPL